ncbi:MAG: hypothetical protein V2J42_03095 [Wenzhouxiangella sp.]|jgi:hypothetical protein|nr:hypothetical protein [Wenzhouxiangella sp.]
MMMLKRYPALILALLPAMTLADPDLDPLVGEWSISTTEEPGDCADTRMLFDLEGDYDLRVAEEGRWKPLFGGQWSRDGGFVTMRHAAGAERFEFELESDRRIVLVGLDGPVDRALGVGYLDLGRCFAP